MFRRAHTEEERQKIGDGVRRAYEQMEKEKNEMRKEKIRKYQINKNKLYKWMLSNKDKVLETLKK